MKSTTLLIFAFLALNLNLAFGQDKPKVILITLDGLRWQELFSGADPLLVANKDFVHDTIALKSQFWKETKEARREVLMPFLWKEVAQMG